MIDQEFNTLILCSFRYALGRRTYISLEMAEIIQKYKDKLPVWVKEQMIKDIKESIKRDEAGMNCDTAVWTQLAEELKC